MPHTSALTFRFFQNHHPQYNIKELNHLPPYSRVEAWIRYLSRVPDPKKPLGYPQKARHADNLQFLKNVGWIQKKGLETVARIQIM